MPSYAISGFATLSQKFLGKNVASQSYAKSALMYFLAGYNPAGDLLSIGRPDESTIFAGVPLSAADLSTLVDKASYNPRIQGFKTNNTQVVGARSSNPAVANPTTASQGQALQNTAQFYWMMYMKTPIEVWQFDMDMAIQGKEGDGLGLAVGSVVEGASRIGMEEHVDQLAARLLYGSPSSQFVQPNDDLQGIITAGTANNLYGQVDRSGLDADDPWNAVTVSSAFPRDIYKIVQDINIKQKFSVYGGGVNLILAGGDNYITFKNQILARQKDAGIVTTPAGMGLPTMAKMGVEREVLRADNVYVMHEPFLDTCYANQAGTTTPLYTAQPGYVVCLNTRLIKLLFHPKYKMKVSPFVDLSDKARSAPMTTQSFITTAAILACDRPRVGVGLYTNLV